MAAMRAPAGPRTGRAVRVTPLRLRRCRFPRSSAPGRHGAGLRYAANPRDVVSRERLEKNLTKKKFASFRAKIDGAKDLKPSEVLGIFLEVYQYLDYLKDNFINADERQDNVAELVSFVATFNNMSELLEKLSLLQSTDDPTSSSEAGLRRASEQSNTKRGVHRKEMVTLMTMHMAKGLEFDAVFLIGIAEGLIPHSRSIDKELQVEEERRLMYVAMTRARKKLFISFYGMPSRFISEIPEDCIKLVTASDGVDIDISQDDGDVIYF